MVHMRKLLQLSAFLVLVVAVQPTRTQEFLKPDLNADRNLRRLHDILRHPPGLSDARHHDTYLSLIGLGNEETLPLLLERLRQDYGESAPVLPPGTKQGFVCTHVHLVDAIRSIANTDQGMFYSGWAKWWDENRKYPRLKWILDGFIKGGLHAIDPPDKRFGLELIKALAGEREHFAINAHWLLLQAPRSERALWVISAASSEQRLLRMGALRDLEQIDTSTQSDVIRKLAGDVDQEVRELAASLLKKQH
jgi:hypothetical protein